MESPYSSNQNNNNNFLSVIGLSPSAFALCPNPFCNAPFSKFSDHSIHNWATILSCQCSTPEISWFICRTCTNQRTKLVSASQLKRHYHVHHSNKKRKAVVLLHGDEERVSITTLSENQITDSNFSLDTSCDNSCNVINLDDIFVDPITLTQQNCMIPSHIQYNHLSSVASRFFQYENPGGNGLSYLTALAFTNNEQLTFKIDSHDAILYSNAVRLCLSIPRGSQSLLCNIFGDMYKKFANHGCSSITFSKNQTSECSKIEVQLPTIYRNLRSQFLQGKCSFLQNIPLPSYEVVGSHLYVSLLSCVAYVLAIGLPITNLVATYIDSGIDQCESTLSHSKRAHKLYEFAKSYGEGVFDIITYITEWSDCFDPNTSTKNNRGSVYVKSISFPRQWNSLFPLSNYTIPVCIGLGKADRTLVEKKFADELDLFKSSTNPLQFYDSTSQSMKTVYLDLLCSLQDQPERRTSVGLLLGNSTYACRFGYLCDYRCLHKVVKSCNICFQSMLDNGYASPDCRNCVNWDLPEDCDILKFQPNQNYPSDSPYLTNDKMISPHKLTVSYLKEIANLAYNKLTNEVWNESQAKAFLSVHCINNMLSAKILSSAKQVLIRDYIYNDENSSVVQNDTASDECPIPATWLRSIDIDGHVEAVMHLLFLGITKTILSDIHSWLKSKNLFSNFITVIDNFLQPIIQLNLSWCKMIKYGTGKFGGHVSENYLAMARVMKWILFLIQQVVVKNDDHVAQMGILHDVVHSFFAMLSRLMQRHVTIDLVNAVKRHVKIFLTIYADYDERENGQKRLSWIKKYNFLSLLNLDEQIDNYGALLNLWEGGFLGEKIITTLKPEISSGLHKNWSSNLFRKVMRKRFFSMMEIKKQQFDREGFQVNETDLNKRYYSSMTEVLQKILQSEPFVGNYLEDTGELIIILTTNVGYRITACGDIVTKSECIFHKIELDPTENISYVPKKTVECLFLPFIDPNNIGNSFYYIISSTWLEINDLFRLSLPKISKAKYNTSDLI
jgi:hypothetical protein